MHLLLNLPVQIIIPLPIHTILLNSNFSFSFSQKTQTSCHFRDFFFNQISIAIPLLPFSIPNLSCYQALIAAGRMKDLTNRTE